MSSGGGRRGKRHEISGSRKGRSSSPVSPIPGLTIRIGPEFPPAPDRHAGPVDPDHARPVRQGFPLADTDSSSIGPFENGISISLDSRGQKGDRRTLLSRFDDFFYSFMVLELILKLPDRDLFF